jgi:uncharacterized protein YndB with AHSA1/START domain
MKTKKKKHKYIVEYEINASIKMLFPYLSSPQGLSQWFAEDVHIVTQGQDKLYDIVWDGMSHLASLAHLRTNSYAKYIFIDNEEQDEHNLSFIEFKLTHSDMTDTSFLKVTDFSEMNSDTDLKELWEGLIARLKENVGDHR